MTWVLVLTACAAKNPYLRYEMNDDDPSYSYFGDNEDDWTHTFDAQYERARLAFMFGKFEFSYDIWKDLARAGHADAQASLAWTYQTGNGAKKNLKSAFYWYTQAAQQNHAIAQNNLGVLYEKGWGTSRDMTNAAKWYRESAEWGYSYGQYNLGQALLRGRGVKRNRNEGIYWTELAALQGVGDAKTALAKLSGKRTPESHKKNNTAKTKGSDHNAVAMRRERWVNAQKPRSYTIELLSSAKEETIVQYVFHNKLSGTLAYIKHTGPKDRKTRYKLLLGVYTSYEEATQALENLSDKVRGNKPFVRRFAELQSLLEKTAAAAAPKKK